MNVLALKPAESNMDSRTLGSLNPHLTVTGNLEKEKTMQSNNLQVVSNVSAKPIPAADNVATVVKPKKTRKPRAAGVIKVTKVAAPDASSVNQPVVPVNPVSVRPSPRLSKTETVSKDLSETAIFGKNVVLGFSKTFSQSALKLFDPVLFLFKNIFIIAKGLSHLGAPLAMAWFAMYSIEGVATLLIKEPGYMKLGYFVCFAAAASFVWVSFCLWLEFIAQNIKKTLSHWAEVGKSTAT